MTARGYEQANSGFEQLYAAALAGACLRALLTVTHLKWSALALGDCAQAFLQVHMPEEVGAQPPAEEGVACGRAWQRSDSSRRCRV